VLTVVPPLAGVPLARTATSGRMGILVLAAAGVTLELPLLGSLETALIPVAGSTARELVSCMTAAMVTESDANSTSSSKSMSAYFLRGKSTYLQLQSDASPIEAWNMRIESCKLYRCNGSAD
jgi:hypothetical protein